MRKSLLFVVLFSLCLTIRVFSQQDRYTNYNSSSSASIFFFGDNKYSVVIDGREYRDVYDEFNLSSIGAGEHFMEIFRSDLNDRNRPLFKDYIYIPRGCEYIATFDRQGNFQVRNTGCYETNGHCDVCYKPYDKCSCGKHTTKHDDDYNYGNRLSESKLRELVSLINSKSFDDTRITIAKEVVSNYEVAGDQLKTIINTQTFESSKIEVAKHAIDQRYKIRDLYLIYDAFDFESSIDEIVEYSKSKGYGGWVK